MKKLVLIIVAVMAILALAAVDDVEVNLNGTSGGNAFTVKNNASTPDSLLKVFGNGNVKLQENKYLNFGTMEGFSSYGFRDNGGTMEYKNSAGAWTPFTGSPYGFGTYDYGQIFYSHGGGPLYSAYIFPKITIGGSSGGYVPMFPLDVATGTIQNSSSSGGIGIATITDRYTGDGAQPAYLRVSSAGTYRISASVAYKGNSNTDIEVEVFKQGSTAVPTIESWTTGTHDIESLSTAIQTTNNEEASGSINGIHTITTADFNSQTYVYLALCSRLINGTLGTQSGLCINFNIERIK